VRLAHPVRRLVLSHLVGLKRLPADIEDAQRGVRSASSVLDEHRGTLVMALTIFAAGGLLGGALYWLLWERGAVQQDQP
jgi:hypothetical protein